MANTGALTGLSLTTSLQTVWTNPAAEKKVRTVDFRFCNSDGLVSADITQCLLIDVSVNPIASRLVLPVNATVEARDALSIRLIFDPGDSLQASASAPGDIYVTAFKTLEEDA